MQQLRKEAELLVALRRACVDAADACKQTVRSTATATSKKRFEFAEQCKRLNERITDFVKASEVTKQQKCDFAAFMEMCNLQLGPKELVFPDATSKLDPLAKLVESVQTLRKLRNYASLGAHSPLTIMTEQQLTALDKCRTILSETALDSSLWTSLPNPILSIGQELISQPSTADVVEEADEQIKRLTFASEECAEQQAQAVQDGDMKLCEVLYFKKIALQESMVDVFNKIYAALDQHHVDAYLQPMKKVHVIHTESNKEIAALMKRNETIKLRVKSDLRALDEAAHGLRTSASESAAQYTRFIDDCKRSLEQNQKNQDQCLAAIEELEKRLVVLAEERSTVVDRQLVAVEKEKRRLVDVANFQKFQLQHEALLKATLQNTEAAEEVTDIFDEFMCNSCNQLEQQLRLVEDAVEQERLRTHEKRLAHFRNLYLTLGDLQYKKERNLEELDKKIAHTHIQQELAMETFNPKAKEFSQLKKDLVKVREEMESQLNTLQQKSVLHIESFKPTEVALVNSGKQFLHPVEELDRMNRTRQQKLLEYHKLMGSDEKEAAASPQSEMQAIEDLRNQMMPRKPRSSNGLTKRSSSGALGAGGVASELQPLPDAVGSSPTRRLGPN